MTVFKAFLKILEKHKVMLLINLGILLFISALNSRSYEVPTDFESIRPDILIINHDENGELSKDLTEYMYEYCDKADVEEDAEAIQDAFFYRIIQYVMIIPENYSEDFVAGKEPKIEIKSTRNHYASIANMNLKKYLHKAKIYQPVAESSKELVELVRDTVDIETNVEFAQIQNTGSRDLITAYFNFLNYSILSATVYSIGMVVASFREENVKKRTIVSPTSYRKFNKSLILSNGVFAIVIWLFYILLAFIFFRDKLLDNNGLLLIINSFVFNLSAIGLAFLITNVVSDKEGINGLANVISLGASFLSGAFVPAYLLPDLAINISKFTPSFYYINSNMIIKDLIRFDMETLRPVFINMGIIIGFTIAFIVISNIISKRKQVIQ